MANSDRISEVYKGEIWAESTQRVARDRIHWLVAQATGEVLDIGCSQGIASILCARRGLTVLGVDIQADRIEYAKKESEGEPEDVRARLDFRVADASALDLPDGSFDTVIMGEIVEHSEDASPLLKEAARVLRPEGLLALTTPFGLSRHHDHHATFYVDSLVRLLAPYVSIESLEIVDKYLRVRARPGAMADPDRLVLYSQPMMERALVALQGSAQDEKERMRRYDIAIARYEQVNARMKSLEARLAHQAYRTEYVTWQLKSAKNRKWWRLGEALWSAKRPTEALKLPKNLASALKTPPRLTEPKPDTTTGSPDQTGHYSAVTIPEVVVPDGPVARDLKVAVILDVFSSTAFRYEWQQVKFGPDDWREVLERERPALLFVESAWHGNDGRWATMMSAAGAPKQPVRDLVAWCRAQGIPTVFWNKEDPPNFDRFIETAKLFDRVFTVDADCIPRYVEALGHDRVALLPFGAQPRIHNPVAVPGGRKYEVAFAGTYHSKKYPERAAQMDTILAPAREFDLHIYSRISDDPDFAFPPEYTDFIVGSLPYERMLAAYKAYKIFLNVNSVTKSPTMCARRVFELSACGTPVVSGHSRALEEVFGDLVRLSTTPEQTTEALVELMKSADLRDRTGHLAMREVFAKHLYGHRADAILSAAGVSAPRRERSISVILPTNRPEQIDHAIEQVARQVHRPLQLVLVTHGFSSDRAEAKARAAGLENVVVLSADAGLTLGAVLNLGIDAADGAYLAKMDDDNLYGPHYLSDLAYSFDHTTAGLVGKGAHYCEMRTHGVTLLRFPHLEHTEAELVQGGTILADGDVMRRLRFSDLPRAVDSDLLRRAQAEGVGIYSADRFNFVSVRGDREAHTWKVSDEELMRHGRVAFHGPAEEHVVF
ncbi:methyltransferase domain-containing protein [Actinoallomurus purpureus]|uniref:methyltransferase domain-containing protein n=1 Tax=Actinoallomurus purpureus TaxID=478114 RepID=UPI0020933CC8|nr:methyltransferase domain-containing protein [Actinoallomurus purpureus]MCO6003711.1 methyltransferase domain-containing protein [Actinoallomurus purpureus]